MADFNAKTTRSISNGHLPCAGKLQFPSPQAAFRVAKAANGRAKRRKYNGSHQGNVAAYRCEHCGHFHTGRDPMLKPKRRK